jgi:hypothetical protein
MAVAPDADPRRRRGVPDRLLLPPSPRDPQLAARWEQLSFEHRRALALASTRTGRGARATAAGADRRDIEDLALVRALAHARVVTAWRLQVAALVLGWLVLMTLWGFGRSTFPEHEEAWLAAGLAAGAVVWLGASVAAVRRVRRARTVAASLDVDRDT